MIIMSRYMRAQFDKGDLVIGAGIDGYNGYGSGWFLLPQRGRHNYSSVSKCFLCIQSSSNEPSGWAVLLILVLMRSSAYY